MAHDSTEAGHTLSREILALYREARSGTTNDYKDWAMQRYQALVSMRATSWVNGVLTEQGPVFHEARSLGVPDQYWDAFGPLVAAERNLDPLGPLMFANPGCSFITDPSFFPDEFVQTIHRPFNIEWALSGLFIDRHTGLFSAVCWYRDPSMAPFTEADRALHEQLLPHWMEGLGLHRVGMAARELEVASVPGRTIALAAADGAIHHAQPQFGELLAQEFPAWRGNALPPPLLDALRGAAARFDGHHLRAGRRITHDGAWLVQLERRDGSAAERARDAKETLLDQATHALHEEQRRQAVANERRRIMRELHDGVGSQLVGLLNLVNSRSAEPAELEASVRQALDEMRMAVDSMQSDDDPDLGTALANLRYRLQPRLDAAGIRVHWSVPEVLAVQGMGPAEVFQVQRILLEAFTNVLKHSRASAVRVQVGAPDEGRVDILLADDGVGLNGDAGRGQGLANMRHRAAAIGGAIEIAPDRATRGTAVRLRWPG